MKETFLHVNTELASWKGFFSPLLIFISRKPDVAKTQGLLLDREAAVWCQGGEMTK